MVAIHLLSLFVSLSLYIFNYICSTSLEEQDFGSLKTKIKQNFGAPSILYIGWFSNVLCVGKSIQSEPIFFISMDVDNVSNSVGSPMLNRPLKYM